MRLPELQINAWTTALPLNSRSHRVTLAICAVVNLLSAFTVTAWAGAPRPLDLTIRNYGVHTPVWESLQDTLLVNVGETTEFLVQATDADLTCPWLSVDSVVPGVIFEDMGDGSARLTLQFLDSVASPHQLGLLASDGVHSAARSIYLITRGPTASAYPETPAYATRLAWTYVSPGVIDQLRVQDLDGDGIDEILFREQRPGESPQLTIWSLADNNRWDLPTVPGGILGYSLRGTPTGLMPVAWAATHKILELPTLHSGWQQFSTAPARMVQFGCTDLAGDPRALVAGISNSKVYYFMGPDYCYYDAQDWGGDLSIRANDVDIGQWKNLANEYSPGTLRFDFHQVVQGNQIVDVLVPRYRAYTQTVWPGGMCSPWPYYEEDQFDLVSVTGHTTGPAIVDSLFFNKFLFSTPYQSVDHVLVGLGPYDSRHGAGATVVYANYNGSMRGELVILTREGEWSSEHNIFKTLEPFDNGGIATLPDVSTEAMLLTNDRERGYVFSIPEGRLVAAVSMPGLAEDFLTGYVLSPSRRDIVYGTRSSIRVFAIAPNPELGATGVGIHVVANSEEGGGIDANGDGVIDLLDAVYLIDRADAPAAQRVLLELFRK